MFEAVRIDAKSNKQFFHKIGSVWSFFLPSSPTRFGGFSDHAQFFPFRRDRNSPSLYKCRVRPSGNFAKAEKLKIIGEYTEIEIGNGADALDRRPNLAAALKAARK